MATVAYYPSQQHASLFRDTQQSTTQLEAGVPAGFPEKLRSPLAWTRDGIEKKRNEWMVELGNDDIKAVEQALAGFEGKNGQLR
jgi:hypothetical protein